jgi:hypothetical protein
LDLGGRAVAAQVRPKPAHAAPALTETLTLMSVAVERNALAKGRTVGETLTARAALRDDRSDGRVVQIE